MYQQFKPDKFMIVLENEGTREALKGLIELIVQDGRPLESVYIEGNSIYMVPHKEG